MLPFLTNNFGCVSPHLNQPLNLLGLVGQRDSAECPCLFFFSLGCHLMPGGETLIWRLYRTFKMLHPHGDVSWGLWVQLSVLIPATSSWASYDMMDGLQWECLGRELPTDKPRKSKGELWWIAIFYFIFFLKHPYFIQIKLRYKKSLNLEYW